MTTRRGTLIATNLVEQICANHIPLVPKVLRKPLPDRDDHLLIRLLTVPQAVRRPDLRLEAVQVEQHEDLLLRGAAHKNFEQLAVAEDVELCVGEGRDRGPLDDGVADKVVEGDGDTYRVEAVRAQNVKDTPEVVLVEALEAVLGALHAVPGDALDVEGVDACVEDACGRVEAWGDVAQLVAAQGGAEEDVEEGEGGDEDKDSQAALGGEVLEEGEA